MVLGSVVQPSVLFWNPYMHACTGVCLGTGMFLSHWSFSARGVLCVTFLNGSFLSAQGCRFLCKQGRCQGRARLPSAPPVGSPNPRGPFLLSAALTPYGG